MVTPSSAGPRPHVVIIGGGVIGISTAISLLDHPTSPYCVTVISEDLPSLDPTSYSPNSSDPAPASYASAWAGAHHVSDAKTERLLNFDKTTYRVISLLDEKLNFGKNDGVTDKASKEQAALIKVHQVEYWQRQEDFDGVEKAISWYPNYSPLPSASLPSDVEFGCTFETYDFNVPSYLPCLYRLFESLGGVAIKRKVVGNVAEALSGSKTPPPDGIIVSPGLGARQLLNDEDVHPVRGQTILVRAPWCTTPSPPSLRPEWTGMSRVNQDGFRDMYILPRGDGTFIVGGTRLPHDWDDQPREETTVEILNRALEFMPGLAIPLENTTAEKKEQGRVLTLADEKSVHIVGVNVGLRPSRSSGIRLERAAEPTQEGGSSIPVIYSYGYGGFGYQCSWGAAFAARDLVDDALKRSRAPTNSTIRSLD